MGVIIDLKLSYASAAATLLAFGAIGCGKKDAASDTIATVNGDTISTKEYLDYLERKNQVIVDTSRGPQIAQSVGSVGLQALRDLVDRQLVIQLAKEDGVAPSQGDIVKELDFRNKQRADYTNQMVANTGMTLEMLKNDIAFDLSREHLLTKGITVTPADVDQYIKENPNQFMEPATANLLWIVVAEQNKTKQVDQDLAVGQNFQTVATRYSVAPQARETGGAYPVNQIDQMTPKLKEIVEKTPENKTTDWLQDGKNYVKFYVQSKSPAKPIKMDDIKKELVRRQLAIQRGQLGTDLARRLQDKLKASKITVTPAQLNMPWTRLFEQLKKDIGNSAATTPPTGGTATTTGATGTTATGSTPTGSAAATGGSPR